MGRLPLLLLAAAWARGASARVSGYHVDDEACSGLNHDNITKQVPICAKFFGVRQVQECAKFNGIVEIHRSRILRQ